MALYHTYRPQSFADVIGQDHIVTTLEQAVKQRRIGHAYLFSGTRGTGKTSVARILARHMLQESVQDSALREHIAAAILEDSLVDFIEIDAASNRKIDDMRDLIAKVGFNPSVAGAKVYLIDEVHMLTNESFNALLKTLEEPPPYAYFILATTELHKVPETIQSRCQRFLFRRVKDDDIITRLQYIVDQEKIPADREALRSIARQASGSFRDGIALLDQLRSLPHITAKDVAERVGTVAESFADDMEQALADKDLRRIRDIIDVMEAQNTPPEPVATGLLERARRSMHAAIDEGASPAPWMRQIDGLLHALKSMRQSPFPSVALEAALLHCIHDAASATDRTENIRPHTPEQKPRPSAAPSHQPHPSPQPIQTSNAPQMANVTQHPALVEAIPLTKDAVLQQWDTILKLVSPPSVRMSLKCAMVGSVEGSRLTLLFPSAFNRDRVAQTQASRSVEDVIGKLFHTTVHLECEVRDDAVMPASGSDAPTDLAAAAAEVFA